MVAESFNVGMGLDLQNEFLFLSAVVLHIDGIGKQLQWCHMKKCSTW